MPLPATGSRSRWGTGMRSGLLAALGALLAFGLAARGERLGVRIAAGASTVPLALTLLLHVQSRRLDCIGDRHRRRSSSRCTPAPARSDDGDRRPLACPRCASRLIIRPVDGERRPHARRGRRGRAHRRRRGRRPRTRRRRSSDSRRGVRVSGSSVLGRSPDRKCRGCRRRRSPRCCRGARTRGAVCDCEVVRRRHDGRRGRLERTPLQPVRQRPRRTVAGCARRRFRESGARIRCRELTKRYWLEHRPGAWSIRDAHTLYVEMLAELGPVGLVLILAVFGFPLVLAVRSRRRPPVPIAASSSSPFSRARHRLGLGVSGSHARRDRVRERDRRRSERRKRSDSPASDRSPCDRRRLVPLVAVVTVGNRAERRRCDCLRRARLRPVEKGSRESRATRAVVGGAARAAGTSPGGAG